ncbi:MAG: 2-hydroxyacyl-CoA dehydratase [Chloroflexi bacterium]|nr:2-hydroxyacyl-CoA dehydratase [Chloroflexota bacterium]
MRALEKFREIFAQRHEYAREWKANHDGRVAGYFCIYVPEEILYAANVLPVRVIGSREPEDVTEPYITGWWCPHTRSALAEALKGRYDYVDAIMIGNSCPHIFQTFFSWSRNLSPSLAYDFWVPMNLRNPSALEMMSKQFKELQDTVEKWLGKSITRDDLRQSIATYNDNRHLLHQLYELRKKDEPPISGAETMEITLAGMVTDKENHSRLLRETLKELEDTNSHRDPGVRLLLLASEFDDVEVVRFIESLGATVVIDEMCTGSRYFWGPPAPTDGDLMRGLVDRYLNRPSVCPHKDIVERYRLPQIMRFIEEYRVQGVVYLLEKFCEPHGYDLPKLKALFEARGLPFILLEVDLTTPVGQFRTRVEAFLDIIREKAAIG